MTADGPAGPVRCVLEEPWHPSYPHVFAQGGEIRKIPVRRLVPGMPPSQGGAGFSGAGPTGACA